MADFNDNTQNRAGTHYWGDKLTYSGPDVTNYRKNVYTPAASKATVTGSPEDIRDYVNK